MTCIARISTQTFRLEMKGALRWGQGSQLNALHHMLIKVETDEGHTGIAEAPVRPTIYGETLASMKAIIREHLAPALVGVALDDTQSIARAFMMIANNHVAKGALDIAIHDAKAAAEGVSLQRVWSGHNTRIPVSFILGISDRDSMLKEARYVVEQGVKVFKIKIGRDLKHDSEVVSVLRHEFGDDVTLYADANETLTPDNAAKTLTQLAKLGLAYVEEPLPTYYLKDRSNLKKAQILPIIADDSCFSLNDLKRELEADTFDILNIKPARTGFTTSDVMLTLATNASKDVMIGSQASSGLGTLHCAIFASRTGVNKPSELSFPLKLHSDSLTQPLEFKDGFLLLDELPAPVINPGVLQGG